MEEQFLRSSTVLASDEASFATSLGSHALKSAQDFAPKPDHKLSVEHVQKSMESPTHFSDPMYDCGQKGGKSAGALKRVAPFCPPITAQNKRTGGSMRGSKVRAECTSKSPSISVRTKTRGEDDQRKTLEATNEASVYCITKSAYQVDDIDMEKGIRPYSSCSQVKDFGTSMEPISSQLNICERVEVVVDPELDQCTSSQPLHPPRSKLTGSSKRDIKKSTLAINECDSLKQALCSVGGEGMGVGVVPTVALAVPIMFGVIGSDPRLRVDPSLLAPSAENRRNHRLCSKFGRYPSVHTSRSRYTTQRFSRCRAKLSFVRDRKHVCSKRRAAALISLLLMAACFLALTTHFNATIEGFFEEREDRAEELSIDPGGLKYSHSLAVVAYWSPWTAWSGCPPGATERSRFRQCIMGNGTEQILADVQQCLSPLRDDASAGDIEVDNCPNETTTQHDNISTVTNSLQEANDSSVGLSQDPPKTPATRHCDECVGDEVCVALAREEVPECRPPLDSRDPTGCGGHCRLGVEMCRKLDRDAFRCLEQQHCFDTEFQCANLLCIPGTKRCDGHNNCYDESDEHDCDCDLQTHFHCHNRTSCLELSKRCDGIIDCWDGSDEVNCTNSCPGDEVMCASGSCVRRAYFCDGLRDCADGSDEPFGCGERCHRHELTCANGRCVSAQTQCDGQDDCGDSTDEINCPLAETSSTKPTSLDTYH